MCDCRAAPNPSPRRRGPSRARPIPGSESAGRRRERGRGKRVEERKQGERGRGRCQEEAGKSALPAPASPWPAAGGVRRGCRFRSHPRSRSRHFLPGATFQAARVLAWEYSVFICASPMAEGRRREDEEEELRERRELGGPRRARGRVLSCYFAAGEGCAEREGVRGTGTEGCAPWGRAGPALDSSGSLSCPDGTGTSRRLFTSSSSLSGGA